MDYENIPFRCCRCHEHVHLFRDCPLSKVDNKEKLNTTKDTKSFQKVASRGRGGKKGPKQQHVEGQKGSQNKLQVLEEPEEITRENQFQEEDAKEKEKKEDTNHSLDIDSQK